MTGTNGIFIIYIDCKEDKVSKGRLLCPYIMEPMGFCDLSDMVLKIDRVLQKKEELEKTESPVCNSMFHDIASEQRTQYFYFLEVLYREHSSWQGRITGTGCPSTYFKSVLELLGKMNQSMEQEELRLKLSCTKRKNKEGR